MSVPYIFLSSWLYVCQKLLNLVEIWQSSDKNKFGNFFGMLFNYRSFCLWWTTTAIVHPVCLVRAARAPGGCQSLDQANQPINYSIALTIVINYYSAQRLTFISPSHARRVEGWVDLAGCLCTETVTHLSTNWAHRRVTSLIQLNTLPLHHATNEW